MIRLSHRVNGGRHLVAGSWQLRLELFRFGRQGFSFVARQPDGWTVHVGISRRSRKPTGAQA